MNKDLNVVFLGGSITEGAGATVYDKSYAALVSNYLKEHYCNININVNIYNMGASGTGSDFGLFRLERDVLSKQPDIVFIEFAVNDRIMNSSDVSVYMEGMIRELLKLKEVPYIILLIAPTMMSDACGDVHKKIAYYYNLPIIDVQDYIWREIGKDKLDWRDMAIDTLHPNDLGHRLYGEYIIRKIEEEKLLEKKNYVFKEKQLTEFQFVDPKIRSYEEAVFYGHWREDNFYLKNRLEVSAISDSVGDCVEFVFKGRFIAVTTLLSRDCGILEIELDGIKGSIDLYMDSDNFFSTAINKANLSFEEHRLILRVSERKNPKSSGNKIVLGGFLVEQ